MPACDFIDDGYTEEFYIAADEGVHGDLSGTFRPALAEVRGKMLDNVGRSEDYAKLAATELANHVVSWSLKDSRGRDVKPTKENFRRVNPALFTKLGDIVFRFAKNDGQKPATEADLKN